MLEMSWGELKSETDAFVFLSTLEHKYSRFNEQRFWELHTLEGLFCFLRLDLCFAPPDFLFLKEGKESVSDG